MSLLDSVLGAMGQSTAGQGGVWGAVAGLLAADAPGGGLPALVQAFNQGGLGEVMSSWIAQGQNLPISAEQIQQVLGSDAVRNIAQQLGLSQGDAAEQLSQLLPKAIDGLTPNGELPAAGLGNIGDLLGGLLKQHG